MLYIYVYESTHTYACIYVNLGLLLVSQYARVQVAVVPRT